MKAKKITASALDKMETPTLEDILAVVNGGRYERFFLKRIKTYSDGSRNGLTRRGGKVYGDLVSLLYACARITGGDVEDIVETLDDIADGDGY